MKLWEEWSSEMLIFQLKSIIILPAMKFCQLLCMDVKHAILFWVKNTNYYVSENKFGPKSEIGEQFIFSNYKDFWGLQKSHDFVWIIKKEATMGWACY